MPEPTTIDDGDVYWEMKWDPARHPDKPPVERVFEEELALARLLVLGAVFVNEYYWKDAWPEDARKITALCVNCNDIFMWGCADAEELLHDEIQDLYDHWIKDQQFGTTVWCCKKRKLMPQRPVRESILRAGVWDLAAMHLEPNPDQK